MKYALGQMHKLDGRNEFVIYKISEDKSEQQVLVN